MQLHPSQKKKGISTYVYGCFLKWWYPQIIHFNRVFHYKPSILGYHHLRKHPYIPPTLFLGSQHLQCQGTESGFNIKHPAIEVLSKSDFAWSDVETALLKLQQRWYVKGHPIIIQSSSKAYSVWQHNTKEPEACSKSAKICKKHLKRNTVGIKLYRNITLGSCLQRAFERTLSS